MNKKINLKTALIISFATNLYANVAKYKYEQYKLPFCFEKHFSKCDKILNQYYYLNCYKYTHKGRIAVAYKLNSKLVQQHIQKRPKFEADLKPEINRGMLLKAEKLERLITIKSTKDVQALNLIHFGEKVKKNKNGTFVLVAFSKIIISNENPSSFTISNEKKFKKQKLSNFKLDCKKLLNN